jgi:hypothetical protein
MDDVSVLADATDPVVARVVTAALATAEADPAVLGLMVKGSLARGERYPGADIDLHALVVNGTGRTTHVATVDGVMVETAYWDEPKFLRRLDEEPSTVYGLIEGRVIYDPDGRIARLRAAAQRRLDDYRPTGEELAGAEHWLRSARIKLQSTAAAGDTLRLALLVSMNLHEVLRWLFLVNRRPMPPQGSVLTHVRRLDTVPAGFPPLLEALGCSTPSGRADAMLELLDWVEPRLRSPRAPGQ